MNYSDHLDASAAQDADDPLLGPEADPDYLTMVGLLLLVLTFASLVALAIYPH